MEKIESNLGPTWWRARKNQEERVRKENIIQSRTNLNGGEPERIKEGGVKWKNSIQSGTELERIRSTREKRHGQSPYNRFRPEVFRALTTFRGILLPDP